MHTAFLRTGDGWRQTSSLDDVLDHNGDLLIAEDRDEVADCVAQIEAIEGMHVTIRGNNVKLSAEPTDWHVSDQTLKRIEIHGSALVEHLGWTKVRTKGVEVEVHNSHWWDKADYSKYDNLVGVKEGDFWRITPDPELWRSAQLALKIVRNKAERERPLSSYEIYEFQRAVSKKFGWDDNLWRIRDTWMVILACDAAQGRRETNKMLKALATKWNKDPKSNESRFSQWVPADVLKRITERLAPVTRSGRVSKLESTTPVQTAD